MPESFRTRRVAELLKKEISRIITQEVHDPKIHDVVITEINVVKDMDLAKVYFTTYDKNDLETIQAGLERSAGFIHRQLQKDLRIRKTPKLLFFIDNTADFANKIDTLIKQIEQ